MKNKGRKGAVQITPTEIYQFVRDYIETGNYSLVAEKNGRDRTAVTRRIKEFIEEHPDEYNKMLDAFLAKNKQEMILKNTYTTTKALEKVGTLLDSNTSLKEAVIAYGTLYDKGALMKGEATSNSAVVIKMSGDIEELAK